MSDKKLVKKWEIKSHKNVQNSSEESYDFFRIQSWAKEENENLYTRTKVDSLSGEIESQYTLSKEDFERDFKWDDFEQGMGNCRLVSVVDSFTNNWDYEKLIRTHVKKNNEWWYDITLPMWFDLNNGEDESIWWVLRKNFFGKEKMVYHITKDDLLPQISILGEKLRLLKDGSKKGINCLVVALWKKINGMVKWDFDYTTLVWGNPINAMDSLLLNFYTVGIDRRLMMKNKDIGFSGMLKRYLKKFDKKTDMMTVCVQWNGSWENMWNVWEGVGNHAVSVDSVFYKKCENKEKKEKSFNFFELLDEDKELWVRLSEPNDAWDYYDIPYREFRDKCYDFQFWSKNYFKVIDDINKDWIYKWNWEYMRSPNYEGYDPQDSLNGNLNEKNSSDERNLVIREWYQLLDWSIVWEEEYESDWLWEECFIVKSYGKDMVVKRKKDKNWYIFSCNWEEIMIDCSLFIDLRKASSNYISYYGYYMSCAAAIVWWFIWSDLLVPSIFNLAWGAYKLWKTIGKLNIDKIAREKYRFFVSAMMLANYINYIKASWPGWKFFINNWELFFEDNKWNQIKWGLEEWVLVDKPWWIEEIWFESEPWVISWEWLGFNRNISNAKKKEVVELLNKLV